MNALNRATLLHISTAANDHPRWLQPMVLLSSLPHKSLDVVNLVTRVPLRVPLRVLDGF